MEYQLINACNKGNLELVQQIYFENPSSAQIELAFQAACTNGHFEVVKWLYQVCPDINISVMNEMAFRLACYMGHLEIAQWLFQIKPTIHISACDEWAFRMACKMGQLEVVQWLLYINPDIDILHKNKAFGFACGYGHLELAQWLYTVCPEIDIRAQNDWAFRIICYNISIGHNMNLEVAKWLQSIRPYRYLLKIKNNKIIRYKVRALEEKRWLDRRLLLVSHFKEDSTNLLYKLPLDLVRNIATFV